MIIGKSTKSCVDRFHENIRYRGGLSSVFNDHDYEFNNFKLTNLDGITVNRNPTCK